MSAPLIRLYKDSDFSQVEDIFFESSTRKDFANDVEKREFREKYLGYYLKKFPDLSFVAENEGRILGYVLGAPTSKDETLYRLQPHLQIFEPYFSQFPAHLHVNCHAEARGQSIGSKLIQRFIQELQNLGASGLHIMTGPDSRNRSFYQKLGFNFSRVELFGGRPILMLGINLTGLVSRP